MVLTNPIGNTCVQAIPISFGTFYLYYLKWGFETS